MWESERKNRFQTPFTRYILLFTIYIAEAKMRRLTVLFYLVFASIVSAQQWEIPITVTDGNNTFELRFGIHPEATDTFDVGLDQKAPPPPPSGNFDSRWKPTGDGSDDLFTDIRNNVIEEKVFILTYQPESGFGPVVLHWDAGMLSDLGTFSIIDNINGLLFSPLDMTTVDSLNISSGGGVLNFGIRIVVNPAGGELSRPEADFSFDNDIGRIPFEVNFTDQSSDTDGEISSWLWNFGDGTTATEQKPIHAYQKSGTYAVNLIVTDNDQLSDTANAEVPIVVLPEYAELISYMDLTNREPVIDEEITVSIVADMSSFGDEFALGSFTGSLKWDPEIIQYTGHSGLQSGFTGVVNEENSLQGQIIFNGIHPSGVRDTITLIDLNYEIINSSAEPSVLDLDYSSMALALNYKEIMPFIRVQDDTIQTVTSIETDNSFPKYFSLNQNYPNPFNPETMVTFSVKNAGRIDLKVYDINGCLIKNLITNKEFAPGNHAVKWDGTDRHQHPVSSGYYFYNLTTENGEFSAVKKMLLIR